MPAEIRDQLLVQVSPTGRLKAVLTHHLERGQKQEVLEVWSSSGRVKSVNLTELDKHGSVYTDGQFRCLAWSSSETRILYVAERKRPKVQPFFFQDRSSQEGEKPSDTIEGEQFVYYDNWGEMLSDNSIPVLCVLDVETKEISVPGGIPGHISPGQALWSPNDKGIVFVGWWHKPFRLGLKACSNRRSALFFLELPGGSCGFWGIYSGALPLLCWAMDNCRVLLSTPQRSRKELLVVDTKLGSVKCITAGTPEGSWTLLGIQQDLLVVTCSSPSCPPSLKVGVLPPAGSEQELQWMRVVETSVLPDLLEWKILTVQPPVTEEGIPYTDLAFEALLLSPQGSPQGGKGFPLIVSPHGGPHAIFEACWRPTMACLCRLGFAVLMVNYRGSLGFGQASIDSLITRVGIQDVEDTQLAVELALQSEPLDPDRIALLGGSHGGFICCHLIGRYPKMYKACAVRSPVINMATLLGTSDIPDWRYTSLGLPYYFERIPSGEDLVAMLLHSPIIHAAKVYTPLLLCVGAKDRRVSPYQTLEYYRVLQARGIPVRLLWYPEGNHTLSGVQTEADFFLNCAQWIMQHLSVETSTGRQQASEKAEISILF